MTMTTTPETKEQAERRRKAEYNARRTAARRAAKAAEAPTPEPTATPLADAAPLLAARLTATPTQTAEFVEQRTDTRKLPVERVLDHLVNDGPQGIDATQEAVALIHAAADFLDTNPGRWAKRTLAFDPTRDYRNHVFGCLKSTINLDEVRVCALGACALVSDNMSIDYPQYWTTKPEVGREVARILDVDPFRGIAAVNDAAYKVAEVTAEMRRRADKAVGQ